MSVSAPGTSVLLIRPSETFSATKGGLLSLAAVRQTMSKSPATPARAKQDASVAAREAIADSTASDSRSADAVEQPVRKASNRKESVRAMAPSTSAGSVGQAGLS